MCHVSRAKLLIYRFVINVSTQHHTSLLWCKAKISFYHKDEYCQYTYLATEMSTKIHSHNTCGTEHLCIVYRHWFAHLYLVRKPGTVLHWDTDNADSCGWLYQPPPVNSKKVTLAWGFQCRLFKRRPHKAHHAKMLWDWRDWNAIKLKRGQVHYNASDIVLQNSLLQQSTQPAGRLLAMAGTLGLENCRNWDLPRFCWLR